MRQKIADIFGVGVVLAALCGAVLYHDPVTKLTGRRAPVTTESLAVPEDLVRAVIAVESNGNPHALRFEYKLYQQAGCGGLRGQAYEDCRMSATSIGLMQVIPSFHKQGCELAHWSELFDQQINLSCGKRILADCYKRRGNWRGALECYNGGKSYPDKVFAKLGEGKLVGGLTNK